MNRAAVVQLNTSASIKDNLALLEPFFLEAAKAGVQLLVLPENFAFMGAHEHDKLAVAEEAGTGVIQETITALAKRFRLWVIAGTVPLKTKGTRVRAASIVYDEYGACVARYDKIHLFDVSVNTQETHQESLTIEPGEETVMVDTPIGRVGLSVCYDLRFPELYQQLFLKGVDCFAVPSAFTAVTGNAHWEVLLRARAIENLTYVLAANQGGQHVNGRMTYGHSMIIDPWGVIVGVKNKGTGLVIADIDLSRLHDLRRSFPCHQHHVLQGR